VRLPGFSSTKSLFPQNPKDEEKYRIRTPKRALRILVYARLKGLENDIHVVEHLKKHSTLARTIRLCKELDRNTVGR
jgi:hypothetical protein